MAPDRHGKDSDKIRKAPPFQKNFPNHGTVNVLLPLIYDCLEIGMRTSTCVFTSRDAPFNVADKKGADRTNHTMLLSNSVSSAPSAPVL